MSSSKPTILLVPGAWHSPDLYAPMTDLLVAEGYEYIGISLASIGADPALENWDPDVELIHKTVLGVLDQGKDVVLVVHSYGGLVGSEAMKGLGKKQRESEGKKGGVVRLVYICAFFLELGMHLQAVKNDQPYPWMMVDYETNKVWATQSPHILYNDCTPEVAKAMTASLTHHSWRCFFSNVTYAAWRDIPSTYLVCENDNAIPGSTQEGMLKNTPGHLFEIERCQAGHSPFLSMPKETADVIRRAAGEKL